MAKNQDQKPQFKLPAIDHKKLVSGDKKPVPETIKGRLSIKLTIPKMERVEGESLASPRLPNNTPRVCEECGKVCSSGKALGGHRRSHIQAAKKEALRIKNGGVDNATPVHSSGLSANNAGGSFVVSNPITCSLCNDGRIFTSMKGLFGHMRSHPERDWRGINPPKNVKHSPASTISDDHDQIDGSSVTGGHVVDLMKSLRGWPVSAKRARSQFIDEASGSFTGSGSGLVEEEQMQEAVNDLLMLALGRPNDCASSNKKRGVEVLNTGYDDVHGSKIPLGGIKIERRCDFSESARERSEIAVIGMDEGKGKATVGSGFGAKDSSLLKKGALRVSQGSTYGYDHGRKFPSGTSKMEERFNNDEGAIRMTEIVRDRMDIGKGKDVVESVVGAKDSSKKMGTWFMEDYEDETEVETDRKIQKKKRLADLEKVGELVDVTHDQIQVIPNEYICSTCNKSFSTHQALGGHRASHNRNKNVNNVQQSALASNVLVTDNGNFHAKPTIKVKVERQAFEEAGKGPRVVAASSGEHQCNLCGMGFPTGQALGGHKRRHWINPADAPSTSSQVTSSAGEVTQTARRVHHFDLNFPPPMEDDDQVIHPVFM